MPPRAPSARLLTALRASVNPTHFICPSCKPGRFLPNALKPPAKRRWTRSTFYSSARSASQIAPVTAVNAQKNIPAEYKELYDALKGLEESASVYVNLSQLQLVLRGLESRDGVTRVAVLGSGNQERAQRLVRALLADPLTEEAEWEKTLAGTSQDGRALLVRYDDTFSVETRHPLLRTLNVPSTLLERNKLELLVHRFHGLPEAGQIRVRPLLTPSLDATASSTGRVSPISYPVHKTLLLWNGLEGLRHALALDPERDNSNSEGLLKFVSDVNWDQDLQLDSNVLLVNLGRGEKAIKELRQSLQRSQDYEHDWLKSHISEIEPFLTSGISIDQTFGVKPAIRNLISFLILDVERAIAHADHEASHEETESNISEKTRRSIHDAITSWAQLAHTELRDELEVVSNSRTWRKLAWWKLLWRVDDVEMISSEVLRRTYLIDAEKNIIFVAGRMQEAGFLGAAPVFAAKESQPLVYTETGVPPAPKLSDLHPAASRSSDSLDEPDDVPLPIEANAAYPWPQQIALSRLNLLQQTIPPLTALAQSSLLASLSTTGLTAALSALVYVSTSTTTIYEAGVIAALGVTWSVRRLQRQWEKARKDWVQGVELEGKRVLDAVENRCRRIVNEAGWKEPDLVAKEERRKAREALKKVEEALAKMG